MIESGQWRPADCAAVPVVVAAAMWGQSDRQASRERAMRRLNERRAAKGLPPLTEEQAAENERRAREGIRYG